MLFIFGAALGSFINVLAVRYDPQHFILDARSIGGRSHCPQCKKTLRWFELVPLLSFFLQRGRCRQCGCPISFQYPLVELFAGLICVLVPLRIASYFPCVFSSGHEPFAICYFLPALWVAVFLALLLIVLIDMKLYIIPDEANIFLGFMGVAVTAFIGLQGGSMTQSSFVGSYAQTFGSLGGVWMNHILAAALAGVLFALIIGITRGKGMGMGDLKLVVPLGLIFGWPDILIIIALSFVVGALYGVCAMTLGKKNLKSAVPFGPFLALASAIVFFWGYEVIDVYMRVLGM